MLVRLTSRDFINGKINRTGLIVVMFYADWCPFSIDFKLTFEDFAEKGHLDCGEANTSHYEDPRWEQFQIRTVPSLLVFADGKVIKRKDGVPLRGLTKTDLDEITTDFRSSDLDS